MKVLILAFLASLYSLSAIAQHTTAPFSESSPDVSSAPIVLSADHPSLASIDNIRYNKGYISYYSREERCEKYLRKKVAGLSVGSLGGACVIAGGIMLGVGLRQQRNAYNNSTYNYNGNDGNGLIIAGSVCVSVGIPTFVTGLPLAAVGIVLSKKYCGQENVNREIDKDRSYIEFQTTGNALVMNF